MSFSRGKTIVFAGAALAAAALACSTSSGQVATQPAVEAVTNTPIVVAAAPTNTPIVVTGAPTNTPYVVTATPAAAAPTSAPGGKTVSAGITTPVFTPYAIAVPAGWTDTHETDASAPMDKLTLAKGAYSIVISQANGGGGECIFGGASADMSQVFASGVGITGVSAQFMRGTADGGLTWTVCEKGPDTFGFPTSFGYITYTLPSPADPATLAEMDGMVASLK